MSFQRTNVALGFLAALTLSAGAVAQDASPAIVIHEPIQGGYMNDRPRSEVEVAVFGQMSVFVDTAEPNQDVELMMLDVQANWWTSQRVLKTAAEGVVNDRGETRYQGRTWINMNFCNEQYCEPAPSEDNGQRRNQVHFAYDGWGESLTVFQRCGGNEQACCRRTDDLCDEGLSCVQENRNIGKDIYRVDGKEICRPKPEAPKKPDPAPQEPPQPTSCGNPGEPCCNNNSCVANSICFSDKTCSAPGSWWNVACECNDSVNWWYAYLHSCAVEGSVPAWAAQCESFGCRGVQAERDASGGQCAPLTVVPL